MNQQASNSNPYTMLAFCFADQDRAGEVMKELKAGKIFEAHHVVAHAVVEVDQYGKAQVHQHGRGGVGASAGIMAGEALALIGGPACWCGPSPVAPSAAPWATLWIGLSPKRTWRS